jgi:hypothetical protein
MLFVLLAGFLVDARVGETGPDGQVKVDFVAEPGRDDGAGGDFGVGGNRSSAARLSATGCSPT